MAMVELTKGFRLLAKGFGRVVVFALLMYSQHVAGQDYPNDTSNYFVYFDDPVLEYDPNYLHSCGTGVDFFNVYRCKYFGGLSTVIDLIDLWGNGGLSGLYHGIQSLQNEYFRIHAQKTNCKRPKSADYNAIWKMEIHFDSSLYGLMNSYQIGVQYPPAVTDNTFNHYFTSNCYISIGITPPKPSKFLKNEKETGSSELGFLTENEPVSLSTSAADIIFPRDSALYGYEIQWRANSSDTWKTITSYPFKVPYSELTEATKEGRKIYLRSRIYRKNGSVEVKYSPYYPEKGEFFKVKKKIDVTKGIVEPCYCAEKTALGHFNVDSITPGDTIKIVRRGDKSKGLPDSTLATVASNNPDLPVYLPVGSYDLVYEYWGAVDLNGKFSLKLADSVYTTVSALPRTINVGATPKEVSCYGGINGEISVVASNGFGEYRYSIDNKKFSTNNVIQNLTAIKKYDVYVLDSKGCKGFVKGVEVSQPTDIVLGVSKIKPVSCKGGNDGQIEFSVEGGTTPYSACNLKLGNDLVKSSNDVFSNCNAANGYLIAVVDANGCVDTLKNIDIPEPAESLALNFDSYGDISCPGGSDGYIKLFASGGTPGYDYSLDGISWKKTQSIFSFENLSRKDSIFFARDTLGCLDTLYHPLAQPNPIKVNEKITNVTCFGDSNGSININLKGGTPSYSIVFSDSKGNSSAIADFSGETIFSNLETGDFSLKITDYNSCVDSSTFRVEQPLLPLSMIIDSVANPTCYGYANGIVRLKPLGGWGDYTFNHVDSSASNKIGLFSMLPQGKHGFLVSDSMGCSLSIDTALTQPTKLEVQSVTVTQLRCYGDGSGAIEVAAKGGTPLYKYDFGLGFSRLGRRPGLMSGELPFIIRDSLGCELYDTAFISQPDRLRALISSRNGTGGVPSCTDSVRVSPTGGTYPYTISILGESTTLPNKGYLLYNRPNGRYPLVISDGNGCLANDTAVVSNLPKPEFRLVEITSPSCANSTNGRVAIDAWSSTGYETYEWYFVTSADTALVASITRSLFDSARKGRYLARIVDQYLCSTDSLIDVSGPSDIEINLRSLRNPKCNGYTDGNVWVETSGGNGSPYSFLWSNGSQVDSTGAVPSGDYSVIVSDTKGCNDTTTFKVVDPPSVKPNIPDMVTVCSNQDYEINAFMANATSYLWYTKDSIVSRESKALLVNAGEYYLQIADKNSCTGLDSMTLDKSSGIIDANFMIADSAFVGDTIVLIEMSWPAPDAIEWHYPAAFTSVYHNDYSVYLVPQMEGTYRIGLTSYVGLCSEYVEKTIVIGAAKRDGGKVSTNEPLIKDVNLFPNPNRGDFSVDIYLNREAETLVELYSIYGQRISFERVVGLSKYSVNVNQRLLPGIYLVRVTAGNETRSLRVVVD